MTTYFYDVIIDKVTHRRSFQASSRKEALEKYEKGFYEDFEILLGLGSYYGRFCQGLYANSKLVTCKLSERCKKCPYKKFLEDEKGALE